MAGLTASANGAKTSAYSWVVLAVLCFVYTFNFMDRQLMSILGEAIKEDLGLTDTQLGMMTGLLFALFYTILGVAAGWIADRGNRVWILGAGCFIWSLFTMLCGFAKTFPIMAVARMGVGVGEAAGAPPSYSIVSDYFPAHKRGMALAIFSLGVPFGMALGAFLGPWITEQWSWRHAFIGIGVGGIVASGILLLVVREPKRGAQEVALDVHMEEAPALPIAKESFGATVNQFFGRPALLTTAISCGLAAFVGYAILNWTAPFMQRAKGLDLGQIKLYYSLMLAVSMGLGTWLAGPLVDRFGGKAKKYYAIVPGIALLLAIPFFLGWVWAPDWRVSMAFLAVPTFLNIFYLAPALAVVQNSVKPSQRTMSGALLLLVLNLVGLGGGPTMIGILSDAAASASLSAFGLTLESCKLAADLRPEACKPALASGLQTALYWLTPFYVLAVLAHFVEAWALSREEKNGVPKPVTIRRNAMMVKLIAGFGGVVIILFAAPASNITTALSSLLAGEAFSLNSFIRGLMILLFGIVAVFGVKDLVGGRGGKVQ